MQQPFHRKLCVEPTIEDIKEKHYKLSLRMSRLVKREAELLAADKRWTRRFNRAKNALKKIRRAKKHVTKTLEALTNNH